MLRSPFALGLIVPWVVLALAIVMRASAVVDGAPSISQRVLRFLPEAREAAEIERVELPLLLAIASVESGGRPDARSGPGARGLLQLMPTTAEELARRAGEPEPELDDPETSLRLGARYLRLQLRRFATRPHGRSLALAAYNAGPARVQDWLDERPLPKRSVALGRWIPYQETRAFVERVGAWEKRYRKLARDGALDAE